MPWVRLDTGLPDHPKILALIAAKKQRAALVYVFGLAYSGRHETDGFVPKMALPFLHASTADANAVERNASTANSDLSTANGYAYTRLCA
jgi:hypothetical protein